MSLKAKKSTRVFLKNFDRLIKTRRMTPYNIESGLMFTLGQEFDKYLTYKSLANEEDEEFVKSNVAKDLMDVHNTLHKKTPLFAAVRNYLITYPEVSGLLATTRETLEARAMEPDSDDLSDEEYDAACEQEKKRTEKYGSQVSILVEVYQRLNQYYENTGSFVREECFRRVGDSDDESV
jgi:ElaB/YqjD/DUF883 family membrane-anchored ribosome-binding protein